MTTHAVAGASASAPRAGSQYARFRAFVQRALSSITAIRAGRRVSNLGARIVRLAAPTAGRAPLRVRVDSQRDAATSEIVDISSFVVSVVTLPDAQPPRPQPQPSTPTPPTSTHSEDSVDSLLRCFDRAALSRHFYTSSFSLLAAERARAASFWDSLAHHERINVLTESSCYIVELAHEHQEPLVTFALYAAITCIYGLDDAALVRAWRTRILHVNSSQVATLVARLTTLDALLDYRNLTLSWASLAESMLTRFASSALWRRIFEDADASADASAGASAATPSDESATPIDLPALVRARAALFSSSDDSADESDASASASALEISVDFGLVADVERGITIDTPLDEAETDFVRQIRYARLKAGISATEQGPDIMEVCVGFFVLRKAIMDTVVSTIYRVSEMMHIAEMPSNSAQSDAQESVPPPAPKEVVPAAAVVAAVAAPASVKRYGRRARKGKISAAGHAAALEKMRAARARAPIDEPSPPPPLAASEPPTASEPSPAPLPNAEMPVIDESAFSISFADFYMHGKECDRYCLACGDRNAESTVLFLPCRDVAACASCAPSLRECPFCNAAIEQRIECNLV